MLAAVWDAWCFLRGGLKLLRTNWKAALIVLGLMAVAWLWFHGQHETRRADRETARADKATADWSAMRDAIVNPKTGWQAAYARLQALRSAEAQASAESMNRAAEAKASASSDAFNQGYAAGRVAGRKTCGAPNATPAPVGVSRPVGVRDPSDDFAGAWAHGSYRPAGSVQPRP